MNPAWTRSAAACAVSLAGMLGAALAAAPPQAALASGTLEYIDRVGTAQPADDIEVWLRFTLAPDSAGLHFSSAPLSGFAAQDLPTEGTRYDPATGSLVAVPMAPGSIHQALLQSWFGCSGNFILADCGAGAYAWSDGSSVPGFPSPVGLTAFDLDPGESIDFLLMRLHPVGGLAAPGVYRLPTSGLQIRFEGTDVQGQPLYAWAGLGVACASGADDCAFERTVQAVPEPAAAGLVAIALAVLVAQAGQGARRHRP